MRNAEQFNPYKAKTVNLTAGVHTLTKDRSKMGAGRVMGPSIAPGFLVTGMGNTRAPGGKFDRANKAAVKTK